MRQTQTIQPALTCALKNVVLVSYRVPESLLLPYVPGGCELDTPATEPDLHLISVVGLTFADTRVSGVPVPTLQRFTQVNLRFYARQGPRHGVVFLRELVTAPLIATLGRLLLAQPFALAALSHEVRVEDGSLEVRTSISYRDHQAQIFLRARNQPAMPAPESHERFVTERHWGFYRTRSGATYRYQLAHPEWPTCPVESAEVSVDPGALLGPEWQVVDWPTGPHSVIFTPGSAATVYQQERV